MSKIKCFCGNVIRTETGEGWPGYRIFSEQVIDDVISQMIDSGTENIVSVFMGNSKDMFVCIDCGRLWIDTEKNAIFTCYRKENLDAPGLETDYK